MGQTTSELINLVASRRVLERIETAARKLEHGTPQQILEWAFQEYGDTLTIATGFGAEGAALIDIAAKINPQFHVFFLDTDFLFPETYELRRRLEARYQIKIHAFKTAITPTAQEHLYGDNLWARDPDLCCRLRKLEPLQAALQGRKAWMTAIRRDQTAARANAQAVEWDRRWNLAKVNPLVTWSKREVWRYLYQNQVPFNPLHSEGYASIGCTHCTRPVQLGEDERAGRWAGFTKTECGLHA
ncbi:MAG: phosphoadenylyl-sulfate reductase [Acidobacteria bacterium]|nr:phosphoadenylyl-sulfate reductase [Acidobacteriota bacterium]